METSSMTYVHGRNHREMISNPLTMQSSTIFRRQVQKDRNELEQSMVGTRWDEHGLHRKSPWV